MTYRTIMVALCGRGDEMPVIHEAVKNCPSHGRETHCPARERTPRRGNVHAHE